MSKISVKFYLTHRYDLIRCFYSGPEWTWERWQWRSTLYSSKLYHYWTAPSDCFVSLMGHSFGGLSPLQRSKTYLWGIGHTHYCSSVGYIKNSHHGYIFCFVLASCKQKQDDQLEHTYSSYVRIQDVALKTCRRRWTIGRSAREGQVYPC